MTDGASFRCGYSTKSTTMRSIAIRDAHCLWDASSRIHLFDWSLVLFVILATAANYICHDFSPDLYYSATCECCRPLSGLKYKDKLTRRNLTESLAPPGIANDCLFSRSTAVIIPSLCTLPFFEWSSFSYAQWRNRYHPTPSATGNLWLHLRLFTIAYLLATLLWESYNGEAGRLIILLFLKIPHPATFMKFSNSFPVVVTDTRSLRLIICISPFILLASAKRKISQRI